MNEFTTLSYSSLIICARDRRGAIYIYIYIYIYILFDF